MSSRLAQRVLLLGWDAADWQIIHPLIDQGYMPKLQKLIERGTSGRIATLHPVISPILWNSIATGKRADKHGILGFVEPTPDGRGARPVSSTSRQSKALWNILSQNGLRSGVVNWFASYPAEPIIGTVFSNRFIGTQPTEGGVPVLDPRSVHPPELLEQAQDFLVGLNEFTTKQLVPFFPERFPSDPADARPRMLARLLAEAAAVQNAAIYLAAGADWDFLAVYLDTIDHAGHGFIEYHPPAMSHVSEEDAAIYGHVVRGIYRFHDLMLGRLLDVAGPETTVLLISDHGFYSDHLRPPVAKHTANPEEKFGPAMNPVAWHALQGVFVAAGAGIKRDELIHGATLLDIAPTVLTLLGLPVPDDMDGQALTQLFTTSVEPARIASYEPPHPRDGMWRGLPAEESNPWAARQAMEQLAALGYIEMPDTNDPQKAAAEAVRERRNNLAHVYFSSGRLREALALLEELLTERDLPQLRCHAALCHLGLRQPAQAEALVAALVDDPANEGLLSRLILGRAKLALKKTDEARALLEPLRQEEGRLPYLMVALGQLALRRGDLEEAGSVVPARAGARREQRRSARRPGNRASTHGSDGGRHLRAHARSSSPTPPCADTCQSRHRPRQQWPDGLGCACLRGRSATGARRAFAASAAGTDPFFREERP